MIETKIKGKQEKESTAAGIAQSFVISRRPANRFVSEAFTKPPLRE